MMTGVSNYFADVCVPDAGKDYSRSKDQDSKNFIKREKALLYMKLCTFLCADK